MKEELVTRVMQSMIKYLDNSQMKALQNVLEITLLQFDIVENDNREEEQIDLLDTFISAKRVEGCSEKTLSYYSTTIQIVVDSIGKDVRHITTEDLRSYMTLYQQSKQLSKTTVDNVRRILSSFFAWLEDEDYIVKSPVRRIHKVKSALTIKVCQAYP